MGYALTYYNVSIAYMSTPQLSVVLIAHIDGGTARLS